MAMGKKTWIIPDCDLPPEGEGVLKGHESVIIVNDSDIDAEIDVSIYYTDAECREGIKWTVGAKRVRCFRPGDPEEMGGYQIPLATQYAMKISSNVEIVLQYGRLDSRQTNLAYYTTLGYGE